MTEELHALVGTRRMGRLLRDRSRDRLTFLYEPQWQEDRASFPPFPVHAPDRDGAWLPGR